MFQRSRAFSRMGFGVLSLYTTFVRSVHTALASTLLIPMEHAPFQEANPETRIGRSRRSTGTTSGSTWMPKGSLWTSQGERAVGRADRTSHHPEGNQLGPSTIFQAAEVKHGVDLPVGLKGSFSANKNRCLSKVCWGLRAPWEIPVLGPWLHGNGHFPKPKRCVNHRKRGAP